MAKNKNFFGRIVSVLSATAVIGGVCYVFRDSLRECQLYKRFADLFDTEDEEDDVFDDTKNNEPVLSSGAGKVQREYITISSGNGQTEESVDTRFTFSEDNNVAAPIQEHDSITTDSVSPEDNNTASTFVQEHDAIDSGISEDSNTVTDSAQENDDTTSVFPENSNTVINSIQGNNDTTSALPESSNTASSYNDTDNTAVSEQAVSREDNIPTILVNSGITSFEEVSDRQKRNSFFTGTISGYENSGLSDDSAEPDVLASQDRLDY